MCCVLLLAGLMFSSAVFAQDEKPSGTAAVAKQVLADPTTYVPAVLTYGALQLDWNSSQRFFKNGFVEDNARYTQSGLPHDRAMSYGAGNAKLVGDSLAILPASIANNALNRFIQRGLTERSPEHRRLWSTLAWIERAAFASYSSYVVAGPHLEQWRKNQRLAKELGY
jgi:hypothetical protein